MCGFNRLAIVFSQLAIFTALLGGTSTITKASAQTEVMICHEANSYPPYIYVENGKSTGLLVDIIERAAQSSPIKLNLYPSPWLRCQKDVQSGRANALFAMVKTPEREKLYRFPTDNPDSYFLWQAQYPAFVKSNSKFDSKSYLPNKGLAAPLGYVVTDVLRKKNWLSPYPYEPNEGLPMVAIDKLDGYVVERLIGKHLVDKLELSTKLKATNVSLLNTNWYIPFNLEFYKNHKEEVDLFWQNISISREQQKTIQIK